MTVASVYAQIEGEEDQLAKIPEVLELWDTFYGA